MKKFFVLLLISMSLLTFSSCEKEVKKQDVLLDYISYINDVSLVGENENYSVIIDEGKKEEVFVDDGKIGKIVDFTTVTVVPKKPNKQNKIEVSLFGDKEQKLELKKDMFTGCYVTTLPTKIAYTKATVEGSEILLTNYLKDAIDVNKILEIVRVEFKEQVESGFKDNVFTKELYIKLIRDNNNIAGGYYYVALIDGENSFSSMLLDCKTGKVLSKKMKN